jgi:hypothetical protein
MLPHRPNLGSDGVPPASFAPERKRMVRDAPLGVNEHRAFPAATRAEMRALGLEPRIKR